MSEKISIIVPVYNESENLGLFPHRFIPVYAAWTGARVSELPADHHPRRHGKSRYGRARAYKVVLDLITEKMLCGYSTRPMYFIGGTEVLACAGGVFLAAWTLLDDCVYGVAAHRNPLLLLSIFLFVTGIRFVLIGLVAELVIRTYFEAQGKTPYIVWQPWNCSAKQAPAGRSGNHIIE